MPENKAHQEPPLEQRLAVATGDTDDGARFDNWGGDRVPVIARTTNQVWANEYVRLLAEGDTGAAFSYLHRLRYEEPGADPWRLLEQSVKRALALGDHPEPAAAPSPKPLAAIEAAPIEGIVLEHAERPAADGPR